MIIRDYKGRIIEHRENPKRTTIFDHIKRIVQYILAVLFVWTFLVIAFSI